MNLGAWLRLAVGWGTVALALAMPMLFGSGGPAFLVLCFAWLFAVILWSAFGVVEVADGLAERVGEPLGTLVLTLSIVVIEVALVASVMSGASDPTLGRDTMFAVLMLVLNGVVGLGLLIGGFRYREQEYNLQGASAFLAVILPLTVVTLVLPNFTRSTPGGTLSTGQAVAFSAFTLALYGCFLVLQTGRHQGFFRLPEGVEGSSHDAMAHAPAFGSVWLQVAVLVASVVPIVLLAKQLAHILEIGIEAVQAPPALGGLMVAVIVFTPEGIAALRAVSVNRLQRAVNLCLGAAASTIGLTVPAVLAIGLLTGQPVELGLAPANMVLLALTLVLSTLTFSGARTTMLEGAMHLMVFLVYLTLIFFP